MNIIKVYKSLSAFLFYLTIVIILAGINFSDTKSPGWFIQPLPVNDAYNDLFFIDSLHGWMVSTGYPGTSDTGYIIHTSNGGYNWVVQKREPQLFWRVQFLDTNFGYVIGGNTTANIQKTTNGGQNWTDISNGFDGVGLKDLSFVNRDTGWICLEDFFSGGVYKTINGGQNWTLQKFDQSAYYLSFINKDTGWYCTNESKLWRTTNGGDNWTLQYTLSSGIGYIYFINGNKGWSQSGNSGIKYTTDGGFNWNNSNTLYYSGLNFSFINANTGYSGTFDLNISKTTNGGINWGYQNTSLIPFSLNSVKKNDTLNAWAGRLLRTTDGGGPIIYTGLQQISSNIPENFKLEQNYPNPFNPVSSIKYQVLRSAELKLIVFDIAGKEIETLVNKKQSPGSYEVRFNGTNLSSGVYLYSLYADGVRIDTKKAVLIK
jgi:photosystem II stability/assembly factor-like uncharacterized protein